MRSFLFGLILGAAGTAGALFYYGYIDMDRAAGEETVVEAVEMEEPGEMEAVEPAAEEATEDMAAAADDMADEAGDDVSADAGDDMADESGDDAASDDEGAGEE